VVLGNPRLDVEAAIAAFPNIVFREIAHQRPPQALRPVKFGAYLSDSFPSAGGNSINRENSVEMCLKVVSATSAAVLLSHSSAWTAPVLRMVAVADFIAVPKEDVALTGQS
jgi:hypothetical protein